MLRRLTICALALALLGAGVAAPAAAGGAKARSAAPLVRIGGPAKLKAARKLTFLLACSAPCRVTVTVKLILPGPNLVSTVSGVIQPGHPRPDTLTLNASATHDLKASYRQCRLKVIARARNLSTNARQTARRTFLFKQ